MSDGLKTIRYRGCPGRIDAVTDSMVKRLLPVLMFCVIGASPSAENWPQWRGPALNGVSGEKNLPIRWSATENVTWKLALPAWSGSTPVVWADYVFLNMSDGRDLSLWAVDRNRGTALWKRPLG